MKALVGLVIVAVMMSSCMNHYCPTYDNAKGRSAAMSSAKKSKSAKVNKTPYYKTTRLAEKD